MINTLDYHPEQKKFFLCKKRFIVVPAGRRCLEEGTMVATPNGPVPIESLKVGDQVIGHNGKNKAEVTTVTATWDNGVQDVVPLYNEKGRRLLSATKTHKFLTTNGSMEVGRFSDQQEIVSVDGIRLVSTGTSCSAKTYDITVGNETNLYVLHEGGLVSSNSGKTEVCKRRIIKAALESTKFENPKFFCAAPTREQAKRIFWDDLKRYSWKKFITDISESILVIKYVNGSEIHVIGMDKPERVEGTPWDGCVLDEFANMRESAWTENIRPALSDRQGFAIFIGVPEGRNHFYKLYKAAQKDDTGNWATFTWKSEEVLPKEEIEAAKRDMDDLTFQQEFCASFVVFEGCAYYPFNDAIHCERNLTYDKRRKLIFCFDFNVSPGVAVVCQEDPNYDLTKVIGEVYVKRGSNTELICRELLNTWGDHKGMVHCYGDFTGGASGSAKMSGSDWDIIERILFERFGSKLSIMLKPNPRERERVNAVNSRLLSYDKTVRLLVDPDKAPMLIKDFEGVQLVKDGSGGIDKDTDQYLTHLCFGKGTKVTTDLGSINVEDLPKEGLIKTFDGSFTRYVNPGSRGFKKTVKVVLSDNNEIICTEDHQFLTLEGWKKAIDLSSDTFLFSTKIYNLLGENFSDQVSIKGKECREKLSEIIKKHSDKIKKLFYDVGIKQVIDNGVEEVFCPIVETGCFTLFDNIIVSNSDALGYYIHYEFPIRDTILKTGRAGGF